MAFTVGTTLEQLNAQRTQIQNEIQRRGGAAKAPGFADQLRQVDAAIAAMKSSNLGANFVLGTTPERLAEQKARAEAEIAARGGTAPVNQARLDAINTAISQMTPAPPPPPTNTPPSGGTDTTNDNVVVGDSPPTVPGGPPGPTPPVSLPPGQTIPGPFDPGAPVDTAPPESKPEDVVDATGDIKNAATGVEAEIVGAESEANRNLQLSNPNEITPFGTKQITTDENGNVIVTEKLSENQQQILNQGEGLTRTGQQLAAQQLGQSGLGTAFQPNTVARTTSGDLAANRERIEKALYAKMTRDLETREGREMEETRQRLNVQGIPYSNDPNSRYQRTLRDVTDRYDRQRENANQTAIEMGGNEWKTDFGINEQTIANQISQGRDIRNQNLGEVNSLQNMGTGLMLPNFNPYQGPNYDPANPLDAYALFENLDDVDKQRALQKAIAKMQNQQNGGGGNGGSSGPSTPDNGGAFEGL